MSGGTSEHSVAHGRIVKRFDASFTSGRLWLLAAGASLALLVHFAPGRLGAAFAPRAALEAAFSIAYSAFGGDDDTVDLHDGRSRVAARWQATFERFARDDRTGPPAADGVVFVGSSSIDFWSDLPAQFPTQHVVQRGLAGATIADCARNVDRLILPSRPRVVVFYAGDNDIAAGVAPERVLADFESLVRDVHRTLPATRIVFVSIKPSPLRAGLMPAIREANALIAAYARSDARLDFVDIFDAMLDRDARPRRELFLADGLHMTPAGYAIWREAIGPRL